MPGSTRMPVAFIPHGGGPWPFVETGFPKDEAASLTSYLQSLARVPPAAPAALLVISGHWEARVPTVMTSTHPLLLYDYSGFPPESYALTWPAAGSPALASRVESLLKEAGLTSATDSTRGFDHGTFVPLKVAYPDAAIPAVQLSLVQGLEPDLHIALGRALAPLRDENIFIIGSGMTFHNLRAFFGGGAAAPQAKVFDEWLRDAMEQEAGERNRRLARWADAPGARVAHPREEHLMPLLVVAGAAENDRATLAYSGTMMGLRHSAFHFGVN